MTYKYNIIYTTHCKKVAEMPEKYNELYLLINKI